MLQNSEERKHIYDGSFRWEFNSSRSPWIDARSLGSSGYDQQNRKIVTYRNVMGNCSYCHSSYDQHNFDRIILGVIGHTLSSTHEFIMRTTAPLILVALGIFYVVLDFRGFSRHNHQNFTKTDASSEKSKFAIITSLGTALFFTMCCDWTLLSHSRSLWLAGYSPRFNNLSDCDYSRYASDDKSGSRGGRENKVAFSKAS